jgi:hypothetical protein
MVSTLQIVSSLLYFLVTLPCSTSFALAIHNKNNGRTNNNHLSLAMTNNRKTTTAKTSTNSNICPLLEAPQNPAATFEAAMG